MSETALKQTCNLPYDPAIELPIMEHFYTIQGEGKHQGIASYFVRLGGCDVGCPWCDVKESWPMENHPVIPINQLIVEAKQFQTKTLIITGGEPLMHNLDAFCTAFKSNEFDTHIETSGTHPLSGKWDWICFSPKKYKKPLPKFYDLAHELKVIVEKEQDLRFAEKQARKTRTKELYLQPEWETKEAMMPVLVSYVKENPKWKISLQMHKYLNIP